ncbi:gliding motility-associated C-terminal domain-containing protein [Parapedobacter koreensis]|nr:gliding motility-associated C-terminal domain-containing protein [Parapedobacter koreensis]
MALFSGHSAMAQLSLHVDEQFFAGKKILKVETTWDDYVWVLGEDNFVARVSPDDEVEDFTAFFADYSTKPFTDISSRTANTLILGTDGDHAFVFSNGNVTHYKASDGLRESSVLSVAMEKQYYIQHGFFPGGSAANWIATPTYLYSAYGSRVTEVDPWKGRYLPHLFRQNDRKAYATTYYYGNSGLGSTCAGPGLSNYDLIVRYLGGATTTIPIDIYSPNADAIKAIYASSRTFDVRTSGEFSVYWASEMGLNYLFNARDCRARSKPVPSFANKHVQTINELHLLSASEDNYLSYMLVGTDDGLYVSDDNQMLRIGMGYSKVDALGNLAIYDTESISQGVPIDAGRKISYSPFPFCEKFLFVATSDGLFKMDYSVNPASYAHVGEQLLFNGHTLQDAVVNTCGEGNDVLSIKFFQDNNNFIHWQRNGEDIVGADTSFVHLTEPGVYRAVMWFGCEDIEIYSKEITVTMTDAPTFTFNYPDTVNSCEGEVFALEVTDVQPGYRYQWYRDGEIIADETMAVLNVTEAGTYHVGVSACGDNFVFSDSVTVRFQRLENPITSDTEILLCEGQPGTITVVGYAPEVIKRWYKDGALLPNESDTVLHVSEPGAYHLELSLGACTVVSELLFIDFVAPPVARIQAAHEGPLCYGTSTTLTADHPIGEAYTYEWSTGETTRSIDVSTPGMYTLVLTNATGCTDTATFEVLAHAPLPMPQLRDTVICVAKGEIVRMEAPTGFMVYRWNGGTSSDRYLDIAAPGTYSLQVEDENGCTATTTFEVRAYCEEITIPNTFSPNGDGINDVWVIGGIEDGSAVVTIFDRNGQEVFHSRGYAVPWDGSYKGRLVPVGAYYYTIITALGERYRGSLTVLY